jgi:hypothetical protein
MSSFKTLGKFTGSEQVTPTVVNIPATGLSPSISQSPTKMSSQIEGIRFLISVSVTNGGTNITKGTVGDFLGYLEIMQGTKSLLKITNMRQLQDFYHIKTGKVLNDVNIPTNTDTINSASLEFTLPFKIVLGSQVVVKTAFNGYSNALEGESVTSGTASTGLAFLYGLSTGGNSESWDVGQTPVVLASGTEVNLGSYLGNAKPIYELYTDVLEDANLNYYKFEIGAKELYYDYPFDLEAYEVEQPQYSHTSGLFRLPISEGIVINTGSNSQSKAILNLSKSEQITLFSRTE